MAGFVLAKPEVDRDSVDFTVSAGQTAATPRRPRLDVQLKCTAQMVVRGDGVFFPLSVKNYDDLRSTELVVPRALMVVVVPEDLGDWIEQTEEALLLRRCGYWRSLRGEPDLPNEETVTVRLPRAQRLTPQALGEIMRTVNDRGVL